MGGGVLGGLALLVIALAAVGSAAMNDYSGSLALQTVGIRVRRPASALVVTALAFVLILWLHTGDISSKFQGVLLVVSYWIPGLVAVTVIDWRSAPGGGPPSTPPRSAPSAATPRRRSSRSSSRMPPRCRS